jgi:hypothetical protein
MKPSPETLRHGPGRKTPPLRASIVRKDGRYYLRVRAQGGDRVFLSPAGDTLSAARARLRAENTALNARSWWLFKDYARRVDEAAIHRAGRSFRAEETRAFLASKRLVVHSDSPERLGHPANPTGAVIRENGFPLNFISTEALRAGGLDAYDVAIFPGGFGYFPDAEVAERIRAFVRGGGGFIGICAGAFLPLRESCGIKGAGLGMLDADYVHFRERGLADMALNPGDPVARGIEASTRTPVYALYRKHPETRRHTLHVSVERCNGPLIRARGRTRVVAYYDGSEPYAAIVRGGFGKGRIVVFSAHPDGYAETARMSSLNDGIQCFKLIKNAILYCAKL